MGNVEVYEGRTFTMKNISVVVISYRNPAYLDLCIQSLVEGQDNPSNEIIVVLDGYAEESLPILEKYEGINIIPLEENRGQTYCHNTGVQLASNEWVLILNDDNVATKGWDTALMSVATSNTVYSPNQIEPRPSIFPDFVIKDFGTTPETFDRRYFDSYVQSINKSTTNERGQTWPVFLEKKWYMIVNGIDAGFPSPAVADWDFFLRLELAGLKCVRYFGTHFYHFASVATKKTPEQLQKSRDGEQASLEYFEWKWGVLPRRNINNSCMSQKFRGIVYEV